MQEESLSAYYPITGQDSWKVMYKLLQMFVLWATLYFPILRNYSQFINMENHLAEPASPYHLHHMSENHEK